jgi:hypothetical protein
MKSLYKMLSVTALSGMLTLSLALSASAQHDHPSGGGGGGGHSSGGGGSHPSGGFSGGHTSVQPQSRPSYTPHTTTQQQHTTVGRPNFGSQRGTAVTPYSGHTIGGAQHTGVTTYRSGSAYGHNHPGGVVGGYHGYLPGNTYYHYNHGNYGTYYRPRLGFAIGVLPYGYYPFYFGDYEYFYSDGLFYEYDNDQYTVVEPPVGAEVTTLPDNAQSIVINGQQFYEVDGVYYKPVTKDDGTLVYEVAGKDGELDTGDNGGGDVNNAPPAPQIGDIVSQLPQGSHKININGQVMYMSPDGIYYQSFADQNGNTEYKIVGLPDEDQSGSDQGSQQ